ncbi:hypothetical protein CAPTEDRAFT_221696 [Capitella teleta]|uniref:Neurotransmitter-gated ion-channel ligand-binding domain-containing protein n=1 Tax=Capitella teleta TaxID=283909 RepID=R7T8U6_CAPTE|nr:hypothetical protein CAPTEDRAFT_221696 [Capitella teleta]|eukprot:ELT87820.1 hypothetical protein CAPTEDRAFT_221696 [Capitella teleta]
MLVKRRERGLSAAPGCLYGESIDSPSACEAALPGLLPDSASDYEDALGPVGCDRIRGVLLCRYWWKCMLANVLLIARLKVLAGYYKSVDDVRCIAQEKHVHKICIRPQHQCPPSRRAAEQRLFDTLTRNYDTSSRPVQMASSPVNVRVSIALHHILDLAEKNQTLITKLWIHEEWQDELLQWNPGRYDGLENIVLPSQVLWLPDIYLFNNADKGHLGLVSVEDSRVHVTSEGIVQWTLPLITHTSCAVDVTYFPFDSQKCFIRLGSWIYEESQVNLTLGSEGMDLSTFSENSELDLLKVEVRREVLESEVMQGAYPQILVSMAVRRRPLYYAYTVIAPTVVLCIMAMFSFMLPCDNGDKVGIGLTVFLSLYVLQLAIAENIPESDSLPLIGVFLTLVMTLNALSLVFATLVINIKKKGDRYRCPPVPRCMLTVCKSFLAKLTFTPFFNFYQFYGHCEEEVIDLGEEKGRGKKNRRSRIKERVCDAQQFQRDIRYEWCFVAEVLDKTLFIIFVAALIAITAGPLIIVPWLVAQQPV